MLDTHLHGCTYVCYIFPQLYICWADISTAVRMLATHFHSCTYVDLIFPQLYVCWAHISTDVCMLATQFHSCTCVGHTFPRLYICLPHISTAVLMLGTHHHRCTYVGHTFPNMYVCWTHISIAVLMLATHFDSCTYLATQFRTRYGRPPASFNHRSIRIMSGYLLQLYACLRYATIARSVKAHNGVFSYGRWPPKSSNCALVFQPTFHSLEKKIVPSNFYAASVSTSPS